jgi:hypothetical protein
MFNHKTVVGLVVAAALAPSASFAAETTQISVDITATAEDLVNLLAGPGVETRNSNFRGSDAQRAIFADANDPLVFGAGFGKGIVLSTGNVTHILGPANRFGSSSLELQGGGDVDIDNEFGIESFDAAVLEFEFKCPELSTGFTFEFVFGSEDYNERIGESVDALAIFIAVDNGQENIALIHDSDGQAFQVSANTINCGRFDGSLDDGGAFDESSTLNFCQRFVSNTPASEFQVDTQLDGFTLPISTMSQMPSEWNTVKIVIADVDGLSTDSAILLAENSLVCAPPAPPPPPPIDPAGGGGQGDPHFKTWRGQRFDFHGVCDLVLLQSKDFESGLDLDVHIRTHMRRDMSYISSAALRIGTDILEVESQGLYYLNGVAGADLPSEFGGFEILHTQPTDKQHIFEVHFGGRERIKIKTYKDFVSVLVEEGEGKHFSKSVGLMGDFAVGHMIARDGKTIIDDANTFGQEWQVLDSEPKLFQTVRFPQHPQVCTMPTPAQGTSQLRRRLSESSVDELAAEKACEHWGEGKDDCVFDVLTTGDLDMAVVGAY